MRVCVCVCVCVRVCVCEGWGTGEEGKTVYRPAVCSLLVSQWPKSQNKERERERERIRGVCERRKRGSMCGYRDVEVSWERVHKEGGKIGWETKVAEKKKEMNKECWQGRKEELVEKRWYVWGWNCAADINIWACYSFFAYFTFRGQRHFLTTLARYTNAQPLPEATAFLPVIVY